MKGGKKKMIDSNNLDVIRKNIKEIMAASNPDVINSLITNVDANTDAIGNINSLIGSTPLPQGQTITSALSFVNFGNLYGVDLKETDSNILSVRLYTTSAKEDNDRLEIQVNINTSKIRYLKFTSGEKTFDKSATLT